MWGWRGWGGGGDLDWGIREGLRVTAATIKGEQIAFLLHSFKLVRQKLQMTMIFYACLICFSANGIKC